jgi:hypothetical protein
MPVRLSALRTGRTLLLRNIIFLLLVVKYFLFSMASKPAVRPTQHSVQWVKRARSPGGNAVEAWAEHSTSAEVRITRIYTSTAPYVRCLVKHRNKLNLTYAHLHVLSNISVAQNQHVMITYPTSHALSIISLDQNHHVMITCPTYTSADHHVSYSFPC